MGFFDAKICVFSEVKGIVTLEGKAVEGATIERSYQLEDDEVIDKATTDVSGIFQMPKVCVKSFRAFYPHQPSILQLITIKHGEESYQAYGFHKGNYDENGERDGKALFMTCELTNPKIRQDITPSRKYLGICRLVDSL